jgi:hypothetical protein
VTAISDDGETFLGPTAARRGGGYRPAISGRSIEPRIFPDTGLNQRKLTDRSGSDSLTRPVGRGHEEECGSTLLAARPIENSFG